MLIVPVVEGMNWRHPPPVTLTLILINFLVFFLYQSGDDARAARAAEHYFSSPLPQLELPRYVEHALERPRANAKRRKPQGASPESINGLAPEQKLALLYTMESDAAFMRELRQQRIITPEHEAFAQWKEARSRYEALQNQVSYLRFGFNPAHPTALTWVTSMFLHGDLMHLLGNMVFLFIVGVAVETLVGTRWFLGLYLLGGMAGDLLSLIVHFGSDMPSVGASGAISALMGVFTVVYARRPVNFFYWIFFYFGFRILPGIVILPVWIAYELVQFFADANSGVGYMAHLGGLIGGAAMGIIAARAKRGKIESFHEERDDSKQYREDFERGVALARKLDFAAANTLFARLTQRRADDLDVLKQWYVVAKAHPESAHFHRVCDLIFKLAAKDTATRRWQCDVFEEYRHKAAPAPRLTPSTVGRMALLLMQDGRLAQAEQAVMVLARVANKYPDFGKLCTLLAERLDAAQSETGGKARAKRLRALAEVAAAPHPPTGV